MASINYKAEGIVSDIQRFSVHDGPGIRTIVFLKGCPLSCLWCSNPESQPKQPVVLFQRDKCIGCGNANWRADSLRPVCSMTGESTEANASVAVNVPVSVQQELLYSRVTG